MRGHQQCRLVPAQIARALKLRRPCSGSSNNARTVSIQAPTSQRATRWRRSGQLRLHLIAARLHIARLDVRQRADEIAVDEVVPAVLTRALHHAMARASIQELAQHARNVLLLRQANFRREAAVFRNRIHVILNDRRVLRHVRQQRDGNIFFDLRQPDLALVSLERLLGDHGQELKQFSADQIAVAVVGIARYRSDCGTSVQHRHHTGVAGAITVHDDLGNVPIIQRNRSHRVQCRPCILERIGQQCILDDRFELAGSARLRARHVLQWRTHRIGPEQARHEDQAIHGNGNTKRQISQPVAVTKGVDCHHKRMRFVIARQIDKIDLGAQRVRVFRRQTAIGEALAGEPEQRIGGLMLVQPITTGAPGPERLHAGVQLEQVRCGFGSLLRIAVNPAHLFLGRWRAQHATIELRTQGLDFAHPLDIWRLAEIGTRPLKFRNDPRWIDFRAFFGAFGVLGHLDAALGGRGFALQLGDVTVEVG